jgi:chromosome partitioning protein
MSKIIAVLNQKGGSGKTTISTNLARSLQADNKRVLLVDSDPQGSARDWNAVSDGEIVTVVGLDRPTLSKDIQPLKANFDYVVIDGAPQIAELSVSAIKCADVILIPVQPSPYDIWSCADLVDIIKARQEVTNGLPKAAFIISRAIKNTNLGKDIADVLKDYGLPVFEHFTTQRVVYAESAAKGLTVLDVDSSAEAKKEILAIKDELLEFIK